MFFAAFPFSSPSSDFKVPSNATATREYETNCLTGKLKAKCTVIKAYVLILKVFEGNSDGDTVLSHWVTQPVMARYCRLKPKTWNEQIALRLELYGKVPAGNT